MTKYKELYNLIKESDFIYGRTDHLYSDVFSVVKLDSIELIFEDRDERARVTLTEEILKESRLERAGTWTIGLTLPNGNHLELNLYKKINLDSVDW
jgi:hypothetical protein